MKIVRLETSVPDCDDVKLTASHVDTAHTPLREVAMRFCRGVGKVLMTTVNHLVKKGSTCRDGKNPGSMCVVGRRVCDQQLVAVRAP